MTYSEPAIEEDDRTRLRRRIQQRRCLVCGSRELVNQKTSYFCPAHIGTHRYCSTCGTLRTCAAHGADHRCKRCASARASAYYHANAERALYQKRLIQIARRKHTRSEQLLEAIRRRIAIAALVRATPGWSWPKRSALIGIEPTYLAETYRKQLRGEGGDVASVETARANASDVMANARHINAAIGANGYVMIKVLGKRKLQRVVRARTRRGVLEVQLLSSGEWDRAETVGIV